MSEKKPLKEAEKTGTGFRLLNQGRQLETSGAKYFREKDIKRGKKVFKNITKSAFVPYQKVSFLAEDQIKKVFESKVFEEIPEEYLKPVLPKGLK